MISKVALLLAILSFQVSASVPLNSSLMIYHEKDLDQCPNRIAELELAHNSRVQIVPTIYAKLINGNVTSYFYKNTKSIAHPITTDYLESYHHKLMTCIQAAQSLDMQVYLTPHLDDLKSGGVYRNEINYDPIQKYNGISFQNIFFSFLNQMSNHELPNIYLSLIGEMGRSLNNHMTSYHKILTLLPEALQVGLSFNFNKMLGDKTPLNKTIPFINELDFLGVSAYYPIPRNCNPQSFELWAQYFYKRMRVYGMKKPLRLHFTEVGIGGDRGNSILAALNPHKGVSGAYSEKNDPWRFNKMKKLRYHYHSCLLEMLKNTPTIQAAFLWNSDSWDVQGVYPFSHKYRDEKISQMIEEHNISSSRLTK